MPLFGRGKTTSQPDTTKHAVPVWPGAWLFTLRSVPHHYHGIKAALEATGDAHVYFSEALAYIRGQGVSLFRVEATGFTFLPHLYDWWHFTERAEAFPFDIVLYVNNTERVGSLRGLSPAEAEALIREHAPRFQPQAAPRAS